MKITKIMKVQTAWGKLPAILFALAVSVYALIVAGGMVRTLEAGGACPDWPTCFGRWTPPVGDLATLDYIHRLTTLLVAPLALAAFAFAYRYRRQTWVFRPLLAVLVLLVAQVGLGAALTLGHAGELFGRAWVSGLHLALSLLIQAAVLAGLVTAWVQRDPAVVARLRFRTPFARLSLLTLAMLLVLMVTGAVVSGAEVAQACQGWPLCNNALTWNGLAQANSALWLNLVHRLVVALTAGLVMALFFQAWRTQRTHTPILVSTTAAAVLFFAQALLGGKLAQGYPAYLLVLHSATAVAVWGVLVVQVFLVGLAGRTVEEEQTDRAAADAALQAGWKRRALDFLLLTKPIVVALLLVTTYAGMVIGAEAWPSLSVTFWTLLGGFMAAGGSGAINQYIDRYDDKKMQRTEKRPIPAGRVTPGEGLAFGVAMTLGSFYLMLAFTNLLAALLSLAGIFYYVLLYSVFLKKTTVQNIVIGGGAGALPPLVGWAAATGSLNVPSLFLFAVVFMWTPPHFWALAIVRRKDYARAGVPMLPVVRGEAETRKQIFIYTLELVGLTLLLPLFGLGGSVYLVGAVILGAWLIGAAYRVWKTEGNKVAWKMYRYSSMYLAFIFLVLMVDRLL